MSDGYGVGKSMHTVEKIYIGLEQHIKATDLTINTTKTKVMIQPRRDLIRQ
jgi:hypothetical protein